MALYLLFESDGRFHQTITHGDDLPRNPDNLEVVEVDRHTLDPHCETYDRKTGKWVLDAEKRKQLDIETSIITMSRIQFYTLIEKLIEQRTNSLDRRITDLESKPTPNA